MIFTSLEAGKAYVEKLSKLKKAACLVQLNEGPVVLDAAYLAANNVKAVASGDPAKLAEKNDSLIMQRVRLTEFTLAVPGKFPAAIEAATGLRATCLELASTPKDGRKFGWDAIKQLYANSSGVPLELSATDAQDLLNFTVDVLHTTAVDSTVSIGLQKATVLELCDFYSPLLGELNTHNGKSFHASATLTGIFQPAPCALGYLNSLVFEPEISGMSAGGKMRDFGWLLTVLFLPLKVDGFEFNVLDCLQKKDVRVSLLSRGITSFSEFPLIESEFNAHFGFEYVGTVKLKVDDENSVELKLLPANAMLRAAKELNDKIKDRQASRQVEPGLKAKAALLAEIAAVPRATELVLARPDADFAACFGASKAKALEAQKVISTSIADSIKLLNIGLKPKEKIKFNSKFLSEFVAKNALPYIRYTQYVPVVGGPIQVLGKAYGDYVPFGVPRFNTTMGREKVSSGLVRRFYMLDPHLNDWIALAAKRDGHDIAVKYELSSKWLTNRRRTSIDEGHVQEIALRYCAKLAVLASQFANVSSLDLAECSAKSAVQKYVLNGTHCLQEIILELATQGLPALNSNDKALKADFVERVVAILSKTAL